MQHTTAQDHQNQQQQQDAQTVSTSPQPNNTTSTPPPPAAAAGTDPPDDDPSSVRSIALLIARFACNNHTICDDELRPVGVGIYPLGALVNHDCRPNCAQTFAGRDIVFR
jgi:hypothetical protein